MRLVGWNANFNNRRRSFEADLHHLAQFDADILVVSETPAPRAGFPLAVQWIGNAELGLGGLAVIAANGM